MTRFRYYMDFGAGWILLTIYDNKLTHILDRDISEFTYRLKLDGTFIMKVSDYTDLADTIETTEILDFRVDEDQNLGGTASWITVFEGEAHLRGNIDWSKDFIEIFNFSSTSKKIDKLRTLWEQKLAFTANSEDNEIICTNGTTPYNLGQLGARLCYHIDGDLSSWGMSELTTMPESLPFDSDKLQIFPTRKFDANINYSQGAAVNEQFTIKEQLDIFTNLFQIYWYIDETIPATSKLIFFRPDDVAVSRLVLDGTYTNCVAADIGKNVLDDTVSKGALLGYDNTNQVWWVRATSTILNNSAMTISAGTGAGTALGDSDNSLFYNTPQENIESLVTNIRRDEYVDEEMVWQEKFKFANEDDDSDFIGYPIKYPNATERTIEYNYNSITTNVYAAAVKMNSSLSPSVVTGLSVVWVTDQGSNEFTTDTGTGLISAATISNEYLSKARLHENWFKINRYHIRSGMYLNDTLISLADDAIEKQIRNYPNYEAILSQLPTNMGTLRWEYVDTDELLALVMRIETNLKTGISVYKSRQFRSWLT